MRAHAPTLRLPLALATLLALGACQGVDQTLHTAPPTDDDRAFFVRRRIEDALAFRAEGRPDGAERQLRAALEVSPDDVRARRLLARVLQENGREEEARTERARADAISPPPPAPPDTPLAASTQGVVVLLVPPEDERGRSAGIAREWPDPAVPRILAERLRVRLPGARVTEFTPASVADARTWLEAGAARAAISLRAERATCGDSRKDGPFALASLRYAAAAASAPGSPPAQAREVIADPDAVACLREAVSAALERALLSPEVTAALAEEGTAGGWSSRAVRALFPTLGEDIAAQIELGRARLAAGRLAEAGRAFRRAAAIDPDDAEVGAYLAEADAALAMAHEIAARGGAPGLSADDEDASGDSVAPRLSESERAALEAQLEDERTLRDRLLAALLVVGDEMRALSPEQRRALRPVDGADPDSAGARLARERAGGPVRASALLAPDGEPLATFWVRASDGEPVLREQDSDRDGRADRWSAVDASGAVEIWEDREGASAPDVHVVRAADGTPERVELLRPVDGRPKRVFTYTDGRLTSDAQDTNGDGRLDRSERFDADGRVAQREEDLDFDGEVDVRTIFERGRVVRREFLKPGLVESVGAVPR